MTIPYPIHESQRPLIKCVFGQVILDEYIFLAYAGCIPANCIGVHRVVQDIHKEAQIE